MKKRIKLPAPRPKTPSQELQLGLSLGEWRCLVVIVLSMFAFVILRVLGFNQL